MVHSPLTTSLTVILIVACTTIVFSQNTPPVVSNVFAEQEEGAKLINISYDVQNASGNPVYIRAYISLDEGSTFSVFQGPVSGDYGSNIIPGINKQIVWDITEEFPDQLDTLCIIKIIASDFTWSSYDTIFNEGYGDYNIVPGGVFQMGDFREWADGGFNRAQPVHPVYLDTFFIGKYELTNAEYKKFIDDSGYKIVEQIYEEEGEIYDPDRNLPDFWNEPINNGGGIPGNENYPVTGVSWFEARAYCRWLSEKTGHIYRLPTEAEWEKAARGTNEWLYPWGNNIDSTYANCNFDNSLTSSLKPVGYYNGSNGTQDNASPYGVYDMIGNVSEWCLDIASNSWRYGWDCGCEYVDENNPGCECYYKYCFDLGIVANPTGVAKNEDNWEDIFYRGGSAYNLPWVCSDRYDHDRLGYMRFHGFRCVLEPVHIGENSSTIFTIDTRKKADFNKLQFGPSVSGVEIPINGKGYLYFDISSYDDPLFSIDSLNIPIITSADEEIQCIAKFMDEGIIRIDLPASLFVQDSNSYYLPDSVIIENETYFVNDPIPSFTVKKTPLTYSRSWDVFASRSAGISGFLGAGAGASLSAAKLSISGEAGMGLKIKKDQNGNILLDRRFEAGVSSMLEAPEASFVVGDVQLSSAKVTTKTIMGQSFQFTDLPISDTLKDMAQSAFILETVSFAGLGLSPFAGVVLLATIQTINALSDMYQVFMNGNVENYWGLGAEGEFSLGLDMSIGEKMDLDVASGTFKGALQAKYLDKHRAPVSKGLPIYELKGNAGSSMELELAGSFNFTVLPFKQPFTDDVPLGSGNFTLFDKGIGGSITFGADQNKDDVFTAFSVALKGGGETTILGTKESTYYNTKLEFGQEHMTTLLASSTSIGKFLSSTALIPLSPASMSIDAASALNEVVDAVGQFPIKATSMETRGTPFELSLGVEFNLGLGLGIGGSVGITGKYLDELEYPRKVTDIYAGNYNYMLTSSEYRPEMQHDALSNVLADLFSGTLPLIKTALQNFMAITKKVVEAGKKFVVEVYDLAEKKVGSIIGSVTSAGNWVIAALSPESTRVTQKSFSTPEVKRIYYSHNVYHKSFSKGNKEVLENAETILFIVSEAMTIGFVPDGDTVTVNSLDSPVDLRMIINDEKLLNNDFTLDDKDQVKVYYYHTDSIGWIQVGGTRDTDTVSTSIIKMGTYALGIELDISEDLSAPIISDRGTSPGLADDPAPEIYAYIHDDRFGTGIDLSETHLILNGDTLDSYYDPTNEKVFYQVQDSNKLADGIHEVKIVATDFAGNKANESFTFTLEGTGTTIEDHRNAGKIVTQNYPNPLSEYTKITYRLEEAGNIEINIYDSKGAYIKQLYRNTLPPGEYSVEWYGTNSYGNRVSPGIYFYQVRTDNYNVVRKMLVIMGE